MGRPRKLSANPDEVELESMDAEEQQEIDGNDLEESKEELPEIPEVTYKPKPAPLLVTVRIREDINRLYIGGKVYSFKANQMAQVPQQVAELLRSDNSAI